MPSQEGKRLKTQLSQASLRSVHQQGAPGLLSPLLPQKLLQALGGVGGGQGCWDTAPSYWNLGAGGGEETQTSLPCTAWLAV